MATIAGVGTLGARGEAGDVSRADLRKRNILGSSQAPLLKVSVLSPQNQDSEIVLTDQETPEFQRQNREFAATVKAAGKPVTFLIGTGYNHFEMHETLGNPYGLLGRAVLEQMKLTRT